MRSRIVMGGSEFSSGNFADLLAAGPKLDVCLVAFLTMEVSKSILLFDPKLILIILLVLRSVSIISLVFLFITCRGVFNCVGSGRGGCMIAIVGDSNCF